KRFDFTAHRHAVGVVIQDPPGPLQAALRLDLDRRTCPAAAKPEKCHEDDPNPEPGADHSCSSSGKPCSWTTKRQKSPSTCPSLALPRRCQVIKEMLSL